jgi:hypothetical protein
MSGREGLAEVIGHRDWVGLPEGRGRVCLITCRRKAGPAIWQPFDRRIPDLSLRYAVRLGWRALSGIGSIYERFQVGRMSRLHVGVSPYSLTEHSGMATPITLTPPEQAYTGARRSPALRNAIVSQMRHCGILGGLSCASGISS